MKKMIILPAFLLCASCVKIQEDVLPKLTVRFSAPNYANKRISAYVFSAGTLQGALRSSNSTDASGNLAEAINAVDSFNCQTPGAMRANSGTYTLHFRIDTTNTSTLVNPTGCATDAGFLSSAALGYTGSLTLSGLDTTVNIAQSDFTGTNTIQLNLGGTGLNAVTRQTTCNFFDGQTGSPIVTSGAPLGSFSGALGYANGFAYAASTATLPGLRADTSYKYACWIDANNSGAYNSGDLIANGTASFTTTVSSWQTVP